MRNFVFVACIVALYRVSNTESSEVCRNSPFDAVIVMDTSDSNDPSLVNAEKSLMKQVVSALLEQNNRFALITFGDNEFVQFKLDTYTTLNDINMAIDYMWLATGTGNLKKVVSYSLQHGFGSGNGDRSDAPNFLVVFCLFKYMNSTEMTEISRLLQNNMVELILIDLHSSLESSNYLSNINRLKVSTTEQMSNTSESVLNFLCTERGILTPWSSWTTCSKTCGEGTIRRFKDCVKRRPHDICEGTRMDVKRCLIRYCTDPIDGGWTYWNEWSACSKSCNNGIQTRKRACSAPTPDFNGEACHGLSTQLRNCSAFKCPDCDFVCGEKALLSNGCEYCICLNTTVTGTVVSNSKQPLENVSVLIDSISLSRLAETDENGYFEIRDVCFDNVSIHFKKNGYVSEKVDINEHKNSLFVNVTLTSYVQPIILKHPESKVRLAGSNVTLCCLADGIPKPKAVEWYRDNVILEGSEPVFAVTNLTHKDAGIYTCRVETDAGITMSNKATLQVFGSSDEMCAKPSFKLVQLPYNCFADRNGTNSSTVDIGNCKQERCVSKGDVLNDTCSDVTKDNCCDDGDTEPVEIYCVGFSYTLRRVSSCKCQRCVLSTTVEGKAFGLSDNGSQIPFAYGYIFVNGKQTAVSNEVGYFQIEAPFDNNKIVAYFVDEILKKFVPVSKVIQIKRNSASYISVVLPIKPKPIDFHSQNGISVNLGGSKFIAPAGGLTIPENALITDDGTPYTGKAKATVHFMDPRILSDLEAANGEFMYRTEDGDAGPLETFGMFHSSFEDLNGNTLKINKKMTFHLDAALFNVSVRSDGSPDLSLWNFDINNGIWIESAKMKYANTGLVGGRRKLLDQVLIGEFTQADIPHIDLTEEKPVYDRVIIGYTNCDHSVPIYGDRIVTHESKVKHNACYVSVSVYTDMSYKQHAGSGTNIVAVTKELYGPKFKGLDSKTTDGNGHACLSVFCDSKVYLYAESKEDGSRLIAKETHDLPFWYGDNFNNTKNNTEVEVNSYNFEEFDDRYSPFVSFENLKVCENDFEKNYKFQFAYYALPISFTTNISENNNDEALSWYPVSPNKPSAMACFLKVSVHIEDNDSQFISKSYQNTVDKNNLYGTYIVGPGFDVTASDKSRKAACIEYRCPGRYSNGGKLFYNATTIVDVNIITSKTCNISYIEPSLDVMSIVNGIRFTASPSFTYGPKFGVYTGNGKADKIRNFCSSGTDSGSVDKYMKPDRNVAVAFICK